MTGIAVPAHRCPEDRERFIAHDHSAKLNGTIATLKGKPLLLYNVFTNSRTIFMVVPSCDTLINNLSCPCSINTNLSQWTFSPIIQRWATMLSGHTLTTSYTPGSAMKHEDAWSRLPLTHHLLQWGRRGHVLDGPSVHNSITAVDIHRLIEMKYIFQSRIILYLVDHLDVAGPFMGHMIPVTVTLKWTDVNIKNLAHRCFPLPYRHFSRVDVALIQVTVHTPGWVFALIQAYNFTTWPLCPNLSHTWLVSFH